MNKNIIFVLDLNADKLGSTERYLIQISKQLKSMNCGVYVLLNGWSEGVGKLIEGVGAKLILMPGKSRYFKLMKIIRKYSLDVAVFNFFSKNSFLPFIFKLSGVKRCILVDDFSDYGIKKRNFVKTMVLKIWFKFSLRFVDKFVGVSEYVRVRSIKDNFISQDKIKLIYNGVQITENPRKKENKDSVFRELGLSDNCKLIMAIGHMIPEKGFQYLIPAFANIFEKIADVELVFLGDGVYKAELEKMVPLQISKKVHFTGSRDDAYRFYQAADICVVPSVWNESFGFVVAEAMVNECPVVASKIGGIPEIVRNNKEGLLVKSRNMASIQEGIEKLLNDLWLRRKFGIAGRKRVINMFSVERMACEMIALIIPKKD